MMEQEHRICYGGGEATRKSLKRVKPYQAPLRGLGIAELEKLRSEESQKRFFPGTELILHPLRPQPNTTVPFITGFDSGSPFGYHVENFPMFWSQLLDSSPLVSSDGTMPLLWSSFQSDTSSSSNSQLSLVTSELKQPPPLQKHEPQQISQVMNHSSLHSVPGAGLQMKLELPSNQSHCGIVDASSWAVQQIKMPQIVGMNHPWPFQMDASQNQRVTVPETIPISHSNCGAMVINGTRGKNSDWSILHNVGVNLNSSDSTVKRDGASEEDLVMPIEGSTLSLVCLPSVCSSAWSQKTMPILPFSEMNVTKKQKKTTESGESKASDTSSAFYNFMELPDSDYLADRDVIATQNRRGWEGLYCVDVDLKL